MTNGDITNRELGLFSGLTRITHAREGCFLSQPGNFRVDENQKIVRVEKCVKSDVCMGCKLADMAVKAMKEWNATDA